VTTIRVQLIDATTQKLLAEADLPADQLPESFEASTTLHIGGDDWHVEQAEPVTRAEYVASGRLRLVIHKITYVDPKELLFSLPTLANELPAMRDGDASAALVLHEDDWRQVELVSSRFEPEIAAELAAIRVIYAARKGVAFEKLHVREHIPEPLAGVALSVDQIKAALGGDVARRELAIRDTPGVVEGGFAFLVDGGAVYGYELNDRVACICVHRMEPDVLFELASAHALVLVDWCAAAILARNP
jgi:hypothetical protein